MASPCQLSPSEQQQIQQWIAAHGTPQQVALRCRIVLASSQGLSDVAIAEQLSVNRKTVILWRRGPRDAGCVGGLARELGILDHLEFRSEPPTYTDGSS